MYKTPPGKKEETRTLNSDPKLLPSIHPSLHPPK